MLRSRQLLQKATVAINKGSSAKDLNSIGTPAYYLLFHHKHPNLFTYRRPGTFSYFAHHISSSFNAIIQLCTSQEARDRFLSGTNVPEDDDEPIIIHTGVLSQSDMGYLKSLTLFQDLSNPLYQQYPKFDLKEFLSGCSFALGEFHKTKDELMPKVLKHQEEDFEASMKAYESNKDNSTAEENSESEDEPGGYGTMNGDTSKLGSVRYTPKLYDIYDVAKNESDSLENRLISMCTPEALDAIYMDAMVRMLVEGRGPEIIRAVGQPNDVAAQETADNFVKKFIKDTRVANVALLNARIEEIYPPVTFQTKNNDDDPDAPLEDESLSPIVNNNDPQVVTQLDVVYELQQTAVDDDGKTELISSMHVGKFETCLQGDPNRYDSDELRWRLAHYRDAIEYVS